MRHSPTRPARFTIPVPKDFALGRDVCSYGYFLLEPNFWDPPTRTLRRVLDLGDIATAVVIAQPPKPHRGEPLAITADTALNATQRAAAKTQITRMLRLDEDYAHIRAFHKLDPRWKKSGRGRLFRSPTFFEDVIKTVTSCNVTWPSTVSMNRRLCDAFGTRSASGLAAFPSPEVLARQRPAALRGRCGVGYRDARIVELAKMFKKGSLAGIPVEKFEDASVPDEQLKKWLMELPGIGPYAASNILQLLGRYGHLPLDTESVRHGKTLLGFKGSSKAIMKKVNAHFAPFKDQAFRSYWFEMWTYYESKRGDATTWDREKTASTFTAAKL